MKIIIYLGNLAHYLHINMNMIEASVLNPQKKVPSPTIARLLSYYRALLESRETAYISSEELAKVTRCHAAQIRKDLTYFGEFGTPGKGYKVEELTHRLRGILGIDHDWDVALIGIGNVGRALLAYQGLRTQGFKITQLFDSDPKKIDMSCAGLKIKDINTMKEELRRDRDSELNISPVKMAIITVPANSAQEVANLVMEVGIKAILNFAPTRIVTPDNINVLNIDITNELTRLSYYLTQPALSAGDYNI